MVFLLSLSASVLIIEGVVGIDGETGWGGTVRGGWGEVGGGKNPCFGTPHEQL